MSVKNVLLNIPTKLSNFLVNPTCKVFQLDSLEASRLSNQGKERLELSPAQCCLLSPAEEKKYCVPFKNTIYTEQLLTLSGRAM